MLAKEAHVIHGVEWRQTLFDCSIIIDSSQAVKVSCATRS